MTAPQPPAGPPQRHEQRGSRHPLLLQQRLNEQVFWPSVVIVGASVALLVGNPAKAEPYRSFLVAAAVGSGLALVLTFLFRLRAYVRCEPGGLELRLPFYRLTVPYPEIKASRPTELFRMFPPSQQRWTQRRFLRSLLGETVVVIELDQLPGNPIWLRLWMSKYMLCPDSVGLVLAVRDWLAFRTELDEFRARSSHR